MSSDQTQSTSFLATSKTEQEICDARTDDFAQLLRIAGIDPRTQLRFRNWSGVSFRGCDLRGFDFTGARLADCDFTNARIKGARFDQAEIQGRNFRAAKDWAAHLKAWVPQDGRSTADASLPSFAVFQDAPFAPELVVIPSGRFLMGSSNDEKDRFDREGPQHEVTVPQRLAVGRYPVTFEEWDFAASGMKRYRAKDEGWGRDRRPVVNVNWEDARAYVAWLTQKTRLSYRLLSEAESEYCRRAGSVTRYAFGDDPLGDHAWYDQNSANRTHPVGEKKPNAWGLHDMYGNVREWCEDAWHSSYKEKPEKLKTNGGPWTTGGRGLKVVRGAAWDDHRGYQRSAFRGTAVNIGHKAVGFRVARTLTS